MRAKYLGKQGPYLFFLAKGPDPDRLDIQKQSARENRELTSEIFRKGNSHTFYR